LFFVLCPEPPPINALGVLLKMEDIAGVRKDCGGRAN
jgi:hypothetical protein